MLFYQEYRKSHLKQFNYFHFTNYSTYDNLLLIQEAHPRNTKKYLNSFKRIYLKKLPQDIKSKCLSLI